jgi:predicted GIY-YIG superfamily endonuclease
MQNNQQNKYYVYLHTFENGSVYIGKGKNNRAYKTSNRNKFYNNTLKKYGKPIIEILFDNITEEESLRLEIEQIKKYKENNYKLLNITDGGEGVSGLKHSEDSKQKMRMNTSARNPIVREKMSLSRLGKPSGRKGISLSEETKNKISESRKGKNSGENHHMFGKTGKDAPNYGLFKNKQIYTFIHPEYGKEQCTIYHLYIKYNLSGSKIYLLANSKKGSHKGWILEDSKFTKKKRPPLSEERKQKLANMQRGKISKRRNNTEYKFINIKTNELMFCTKFKLKELINGSIENINSMINLKEKSLTYKDWCCETKEHLVFKNCAICNSITTNKKYCSDECIKESRKIAKKLKELANSNKSLFML